MIKFPERFGMLKWLWVTLSLVVLDQITKQWADHALEMFRPVELFSNLNLYLAYNEGAAFSFLNNAGGWQRWFFTVIALGVSTFLIFWMRKLEKHEGLTAIGLAFILSGAVGNVIDRILFGHVIDFIQFYYHAESCLPGFSAFRDSTGLQCIWPAFNVADSAITIGATLLIADSLKSIKQGQVAQHKTESKHV